MKVGMEFYIPCMNEEVKKSNSEKKNNEIPQYDASGELKISSYDQGSGLFKRINRWCPGVGVVLKPLF